MLETWPAVKGGTGNHSHSQASLRFHFGRPKAKYGK